MWPLTAHALGSSHLLCALLPPSAFQSRTRDSFTASDAKQFILNVVTAVVSVVIVAALGAAFGWWPLLWGWLQSGEGEVAHRLAFLLVVALLLYRHVAPLRPLPVIVTPVSEPGNYAVLTVRNLGHGGDFYATAEILDVRQPGVSGGFRRLTMRPKWGMDRRGGFSSVSIDRRGTGDLCLAKIFYDETTSGMIEVHLTDEGKKQEWYCYERGDPAGGVEIDLEVTVIRKEAREFFRFLPIPRPYVGRFTVKGKPDGIATLETPPAHWWSRFV